MIQKPTKVLKIVNLAGYQKEAVVSREIVNNPSGTVTVFAFDKGQGLSEHKTSFSALLQILEGRAGIKVAGKVHDLKAGDMIILPANKPYGVVALERFKMLLIMIHG